MKVCSINMEHWENIYTGYPLKDDNIWRQDIKSYLIGCQNYLDKLDYDFILLQETFPIPLKNYYVYYHELAIELESEKVIKNEISQLNSGFWGSSICVNKRNKFLNNIFYNNHYKTNEKGVFCAESKYINGLVYFGEDNMNERFWGFPALMCFNCECEGKLITVINIYGKHYHGNNHLVLDKMYEYIKFVVENYQNNQIIILAGDFNATREPVKNYPNGSPHNIRFFDLIENELKLKYCTDNIRTFDNGYRNDYIFINENNFERVKQPFNEPIKPINEYGKAFTKHYLIDCEINL
jgi:hypothetical protein